MNNIVLLWVNKRTCFEQKSGKALQFKNKKMKNRYLNYLVSCTYKKSIV